MCEDQSNGPKQPPINRRHLLSMLLTAGASMAVIGCVNSKTNTKKKTATTTTAGDDDTTSSDCVEAADETNGPFPADGSNTAGDGSSATLDQVYSGTPIYRSSIAEGMSGSPLDLTITLQNVNNYCEVLSGYYIYIWHCTAGGQYSGYTATNNGGAHSRTETYMRGIQQTDTLGQVTFNTIYPGWYSGRTVHIHVEIYNDMDSAPIKTTQIAFPMVTSRAVVAQTLKGYPGSSGLIENSADNIFSDGTSGQMLAVSGTTSGYTGTISLGIKV